MMIRRAACFAESLFVVEGASIDFSCTGGTHFKGFESWSSIVRFVRGKPIFSFF